MEWIYPAFKFPLTLSLSVVADYLSVLFCNIRTSQGVFLNTVLLWCWYFYFLLGKEWYLKPFWNALVYILIICLPSEPYHWPLRKQIVWNLFLFSALSGAEFFLTYLIVPKVISYHLYFWTGTRMIRGRKFTTVLKQVPTRIIASWNPFQKIDFCEGERFNMNMKLLGENSKMYNLLRGYCGYLRFQSVVKATAIWVYLKRLTCYSYNCRDLSRNFIHEIHSRAFAKLGSITNL